MIGSQPAKYEYDGPSLISPAASAASSLIIFIWRWMAAHGAVEQKNDFKTRTREYTPNFSLQLRLRSNSEELRALLSGANVGFFR